MTTRLCMCGADVDKDPEHSVTVMNIGVEHNVTMEYVACPQMPPDRVLIGPPLGVRNEPSENGVYEWATGSWRIDTDARLHIDARRPEKAEGVAGDPAPE